MFQSIVFAADDDDATVEKNDDDDDDDDGNTGEPERDEYVIRWDKDDALG